MRLVKVIEGDTELLVPEHEKGPGPRATDTPVFYNPAMEMNRDTSISLLRYLDPRGMRILDSMAATGARGIRIATELEPRAVVLTDISDEAVNLILHNSRGLDVQVHKQSVEEHLLANQYRYDYVDIDPFGTPVPYLPVALRFIRRNGVLAVSATDTSVLCGTYPKKCMRVYSAAPMNNWCRHENGLRILIGHIAREAARYDRGVRPLLSYYDGHHFRTYLRVVAGAGKANESIRKLDTYRFGDIDWSLSGEIGPMWSGDLSSDDIVKGMLPLGKLTEDILALWRGEAGMSPFFYETSTLARHLKQPPPPLKDIILRLNSAGYLTVRTHFSPTAFKTEGNTETVLDAFRG